MSPSAPSSSPDAPRSVTQTPCFGALREIHKLFTANSEMLPPSWSLLCCRQKQTLMPLNFYSISSCHSWPSTFLCMGALRLPIFHHRACVWDSSSSDHTNAWPTEGPRPLPFHQETSSMSLAFSVLCGSHASRSFSCNYCPFAKVQINSSLLRKSFLLLFPISVI